MQDVFLGRYSGMTDESINVMLKASDEYVLKLIREGRKSGSIRTDMDDRLLCLFLTGATLKFKAMLELVKNGMGKDMGKKS